MSPALRHDARPLRRPRRAAIRGISALALLAGVMVPLVSTPVAATVTPAATATFATWSTASGASATGSLVSTVVQVAFAGPDGSYPAWGPSITTVDASDVNSYNPAGSPTQSFLDYTQRPGTVTITFDEPVTNLALYTSGFRGSSGPEAYRLNATGTGAWVRVSGDGELAGNVLLSDSTQTGFVNNVVVFDGTLTAVVIETLGDFVDGCCGSQAFTLATLSDVTYPPPSITGVAPTSGPSTGGTTLTITGSGFFEGIEVTVGSDACTDVTLESETQLTCVTPAGPAGAADVTVTTPGGSDALVDAFTYVRSPDPGPTPTPAPGPGPDPVPVAPAFTG